MGPDPYKYLRIREVEKLMDMVPHPEHCRLLLLTNEKCFFPGLLFRNKTTIVEVSIVGLVSRDLEGRYR
jgi:hypothetical protein